MKGDRCAAGKNGHEYKTASSMAMAKEKKDSCTWRIDSAATTGGRLRVSDRVSTHTSVLVNEDIARVALAASIIDDVTSSLTTRPAGGLALLHR